MPGDEIQRAVDELAHRLRRSVVINDPAVHLLYTSPHFGDEDEVRIRAVLQRDAGTKAIGHVLAQGVTNWTTAGVIPPNDELGMKARVCVPIFSKEEGGAHFPFFESPKDFAPIFTDFITAH